MNKYLVAYQLGYSFGTSLGRESKDMMMTMYVVTDKFTLDQISLFQDETLRHMQESDEKNFRYHYVQVMAVSKIDEV